MLALALAAVIASSTPSLDIANSCVLYARQEGIKIPIPTDADLILPNGSPDIGNGALFRYASSSHIAVITGYTENGFTVKESNFKKGQITLKREILWTDRYLIGFVLKDAVKTKIAPKNEY